MRGQDGEGRVLLAHGSGGRFSQELIRQVFLPRLDSAVLHQLDDAAVLEPHTTRLAFTTDSFVVQPLFFPGGDIGRLAVCGTVNDLAMVGAVPRYLVASFIIEEGFLISDLIKVVDSMRCAAEEAGVAIVAGDTKVVESGKADGLFITTAGIGFVPDGVVISGARARAGDRIILSGPIGQHGIAVLCERESLQFGGELQSDCAPLNGLVKAMLEVSKDIHCLRDATRGGLGTVLNELAAQSRVAFRIYEEAIPIEEGVRGACELLGFDPLYVANEGRFVAIVPSELAEEMVERMRRERYGESACIIGEVLNGPPGRVSMVTTLGGTRIVDALAGEILPRIC